MKKFFSSFIDFLFYPVPYIGILVLIVFFGFQIGSVNRRISAIEEKLENVQIVQRVVDE